MRLSKRILNASQNNESILKNKDLRLPQQDLKRKMSQFYNDKNKFPNDKSLLHPLQKTKTINIENVDEFMKVLVSFKM